MYFGMVVSSEMKLSTVGKYAEEKWKEIPSHFKNIALDEFVVMPNHLHGIIRISGTWKPALKRNDTKKTLQDVSPKSGSLSHIIRCYKGGVTYWCGQEGHEFTWHTGFHDRIIPGPRSLEAVREYIRDNPANWEKDRENPERGKSKR
jgi:putative transposase